MNKDKILKRCLWLVIFIFLANLAAMSFYWYSSVWWLDMPMHFMGGVLLFNLFLFVFYDKFLMMPFYKKLLLSLSAVLVAGVGWEIFEILQDRFITASSFNAPDTFSDIFFDLFGGATAFLLFSIRYSRSEKI